MPASADARAVNLEHFARSLLPPTGLWPVFDYSAPHLRGYAAHLNLSTVLLDGAVADGCGDRVMLHHGDGAWTYAQLLDRVQRIARVLTELLGVRPGDCVLLRAGNSPMLAACWLAVVRAGAIAVATSPMLRARELAFVIDKLHVRIALCDVAASSELETVLASSPWLQSVRQFTEWGDAPRAAELDSLVAVQPAGGKAAETAADEIATVVFSSGTTGTPKAVAHSHRELLAACDCWRHPLPIARTDVMCATSSIAFTYGLTSNLLYPLRFRSSSVLLARSTTDALLAAIERHRIAALCTVPTVLHKLLPHAGGDALRSLTKCFSSGEPLGRELWQAWRSATGRGIVEGFGSSELLTRVLSPSADGEPPGSLGRDVPGYTACLLDEEGRILTGAARGLLGIRGPTGCRYLGDEERQRAFVRNGWNVTADVFERDGGGCYWYIGRKDDIIVSSGYNIAAIEVERVIATHPCVLECAVVGVPDPERGAIVRACVVLRDRQEGSAATARLIQDHVKSLIAPYKYPREVVFLDELPRTTSGKVERYKLQAR